jgi:hypothetical protein
VRSDASWLVARKDDCAAPTGTGDRNATVMRTAVLLQHLLARDAEWWMHSGTNLSRRWE